MKNNFKPLFWQDVLYRSAIVCFEEGCIAETDKACMRHGRPESSIILCYGAFEHDVPYFITVKELEKIEKSKFPQSHAYQELDSEIARKTISGGLKIKRTYNRHEQTGATTATFSGKEYRVIKKFMESYDKYVGWDQKDKMQFLEREIRPLYS